MSSLCSRESAFILLLISFLTSQARAQCNTNQNPYCAGNSKFEQLCCPYPAVCYWSDRYGGVGCCQPGSICTGQGNGVTITPTLIPGTAPPTTQTLTTETVATQTAATLVVTTQNGGYSTVTVTGGIAVTNPIGYTTTAGVIIANDAPRAMGPIRAMHFSLELAMLAWILT